MSNEFQNIEHDIENEAHKIEADAENVIHHLEGDAHNVEAEAVPQAEADAKEVKDDAEQLAKDAETQGETELHDVEGDVKQEEELGKDAFSHPTDIPVDAAEGLNDARKDVVTEDEHVAGDVKEDAAEAEGDVKKLETDVRTQVDEDLGHHPAASTDATEASETDANAESEQDAANAPASSPVAGPGPVGPDTPVHEDVDTTVENADGEQVDVNELSAGELADHVAQQQGATLAHAPANTATESADTWHHRIDGTGAAATVTQNPTDPRHQV
jgi:hypothetical protein